MLNVITPRNGEPLISATQDFLTASYLLSRRDVMLDRDQFCQLVAFMFDGKEKVDIPPPTIVKVWYSCGEALHCDAVTYGWPPPPGLALTTASLFLRSCDVCVQPVRLWTGKQLFQCLLAPNRSRRYIINFEVKEKNIYGSREHMDPKDGCTCDYAPGYCARARVSVRLCVPACEQARTH